jgi:EAL domain-containing protein (putative c-di-GMP-specific phosphodiesterase class I)
LLYQVGVKSSAKAGGPILRAEILEGLKRGEFHLVYQPQMLADGSRMTSVEALVRWNSPIHGPIGPADFIAIAERDNVIRELGAFVLRQACRDAAGFEGISVAVNVSGNQLSDPHFVDLVLEAAAHAGLPLNRLELELVENVLIENFELIQRVLSQLRGLGVRIALDDFGTGYSSLTYLRKLPLDKIKVDKSFIDDITSVSSAAIVQAIVAMGRALGLKITAEGVETDAQRLFLRVCGCDYLQGYLFSKPISPEAVVEMLGRVQRERRAIA